MIGQQQGDETRNDDDDSSSEKRERKEIERQIKNGQQSRKFLPSLTQTLFSFVLASSPTSAAHYMMRLRALFSFKTVSKEKRVSSTAKNKIKKNGRKREEKEIRAQLPFFASTHTISLARSFFLLIIYCRPIPIKSRTTLRSFIVLRS